MDINCWQFLNLAWSIGVTGDHTWQLQMTARRPSSTVMFLGTSGHDMVNIRSVDYVYRYKNIAADMSWYECLELIGLGTGTVTVHSEIHYKCNLTQITNVINVPGISDPSVPECEVMSSLVIAFLCRLFLMVYAYITKLLQIMKNCFTERNPSKFPSLKVTEQLYFFIILEKFILLLQPSPNRAGLRKDEELQAVELTVFIHGNEKPWNNKYNTI